MKVLQDVFSDNIIRTKSGNEYKPSTAKQMMSSICYYEFKDPKENKND
jgi:hypothetical protein